MISVNQNNNYEFITLIPTVCADKSRILLILIYKSESGAIINTWLNDYDDENKITYFTATQKGWNNENIKIYWLKYIFNRYMKEKIDNHQRLLIVNDYNSYLNIRFINYTD